MFIFLFRPHRHTTYVDAAYCYRPPSVVCRSVWLSVCLSVTVVSLAKTAEPIEMPFGLWAQVGSRNHVLIRWWSRSPMGSGNFDMLDDTLP